MRGWRMLLGCRGKEHQLFFFSFLSVHVVCFLCARCFAGGVSRLFDSLCSVFTAAALPPLAYNLGRSNTHMEGRCWGGGVGTQRGGSAIFPQIIREKKN